MILVHAAERPAPVFYFYLIVFLQLAIVNCSIRVFKTLVQQKSAELAGLPADGAKFRKSAGRFCIAVTCQYWTPLLHN